MDDAHQGFLRIETDPYIYLHFDSNAQRLFQLTQPFLTPKSTFVTSKPFELTPDSYNIIIYCDVVDETVVGGQREKILCISPLTHSHYEYGKWVGKEFSAADYYPLGVKSIQCVDIQLRGDTGDFIPISEGRSYVKLHFRKRHTKLQND